MPQLIIADDPAREAGEEISKLIQEHVGDVVCLLSGGSALGIVEHIHPGKECFHQECSTESKKTAADKTLCEVTECRTIFMMGDERVSGEAKINNYLQLYNLYPNHPVLQKTIETVPEAGESAENFSDRIEKTFLETLTILNNPKIISILGVGTDGHTAGIYPMDERSFRRAYQEDRTYVPVHTGSLTIDSRASFTPNWILNHADNIIGYIVGDAKKDILKNLNENDKKLNERPAELLKLHKRVQVFTDIDIS